MIELEKTLWFIFIKYFNFLSEENKISIHLHFKNRIKPGALWIK